MNGLPLLWLGRFATPVILAQSILWSGGIRWGYWILALLAIPVIFMVALQPSPAPLLAKSDHKAGRANELLVVLIVLFFFFYVGSEHAVSDWMASYSRGMVWRMKPAAYLTSYFLGCADD
jgi:fucose permease